MLEINRNNILNWLRLIKDIYPFNEEGKRLLDKYINTRYKVRRDKELDILYGGYYD